MNIQEKRLQEIKEQLNSRLKLISISFKGIKSDQLNINIQKVLCNLSQQSSIPNSETFGFFNSVRARMLNDNSKQSEEAKNYQESDLQKFANDFNNFKNVLVMMNQYKDEIDSSIIRGSYKDLKLCYSEDIKKIDSFNNKVEEKKQMINKEIFKNGLIMLTKSFKDNIKGELSRHKIQEGEELTKLLDDCFNKVKDSGKFLGNIKITCNYAVDISKDVLLDNKFRNSYNKFNLECEEEELLKEYYKLL